MIELEEISKEYRSVFRRRTVAALENVSLRVGPGECVGIVGLNGAGKSTLLRILLGYVRPTHGRALIDGVDPRTYVERNGIAYVPERVAVPPGWIVRDAMRTWAMLGDLGQDAWERVELSLERLGLQPLADRKVGSLSKGNLQRLAIAQAILAPRQVMVLDEPTDGLDPVWVAELREIIQRWRAESPDRVVVIASHNLPEIDKIADRKLLLHSGRIEGLLPDTGDLEASFLGRVRELAGTTP